MGRAGRLALARLPEVFGSRNSVLGRFGGWSAKGVWWRMFEAI